MLVGLDQTGPGYQILSMALFDSGGSKQGFYALQGAVFYGDREKVTFSKRNEVMPLAILMYPSYATALIAMDQQGFTREVMRIST